MIFTRMYKENFRILVDMTILNSMHPVVSYIGYTICCIMRADYTTILVKIINTKIKQMTDTVMSILFFHEYCCVDCPHYTTYIL
jgi:hypothetical protein